MVIANVGDVAPLKTLPLLRFAKLSPPSVLICHCRWDHRSRS
jgi:hypothetical protein